MKQVRNSRRGHTEYAVILALICVTMIAAISIIGQILFPGNSRPWTWATFGMALLSMPSLLFNGFLAMVGIISCLGFIGEMAIFVRGNTADGSRYTHGKNALGWLAGALLSLTPLYFVRPHMLQLTERWYWSDLAWTSTPLLCLFGLIASNQLYIVWKNRAEKLRLRKLRQIEKRLQLKPGTLGNKELQCLMNIIRQGDSNLSAAGMGVLAALVQTQPGLRSLLAPHHTLINSSLRSHFGFAEALHSQAENGQVVNTDVLVTLGAKVGAGTGSKQISPVTSNSAQLASWIIGARGWRSRELQVSIGYDLGLFPAQRQRSKFIALYLYIATTDLQNFQSLLPRPRRDHGAAYGLLIRGEIVEVRYPGQTCGKRMDYIFPIHPDLPENRLRAIIRQIQLLNLGLMLVAIVDTYQAFFPNELPSWITPKLHGLAEGYRQFEQAFVRLLREYDAYRQADQIHPLDAEDHRHRCQAFSTFRLEECLYPQWEWLAPLYGDNLHWDRLLPALRAIEGMMLHQGAVAGKEVTRGNQFIQDTRLLGFETVAQLEAILANRPWSASPPVCRDPFLDEDDCQSTKFYLDCMHRQLQNGEVQHKAMMDLARFCELQKELKCHSDAATPKL